MTILPTELVQQTEPLKGAVNLNTGKLIFEILMRAEVWRA